MISAVQVLRLLGMTLAYAVFAWGIGYFSIAPSYQRYPADDAFLSLSFSHAGHRKTDCVRLTAEEIAALPPQERKPLDCARERWPLEVELWLDGELLHQGVAQAAGIAHDGIATFYETFPLAPGRYQLEARLRDSGRDTGFDHQRKDAIEVLPGERFIVDFRVDQSGFVFGAR